MNRLEKRLQFPRPFPFVGIRPDDVVAAQRRTPPVNLPPIHAPAKVTASEIQFTGEVGFRAVRDLIEGQGQDSLR
jgi:hypothetical protein